MLHNQSLSTKYPWKTFQDIEWIIDTEGTDTTKLANVIAKYRKEMVDVLKSGEAEDLDDENTLNNLITKLQWKKGILETDLWKTPPCKINLSDNTDIISFWKSIIDDSNPKLKWKPWTNSAIAAEITGTWGINDKIQKALDGIQFLHYYLEDDWVTWDKKDHWKLFKGSSTEMTNIGKTLKNPLISTVLNETKVTKVDTDIKSFVNSVKKTKWNAFYIQSEKLYTDDQRETAIRMSLYLYCAYKIANDPTKITKELCDDINEKLDQIINEEIPKIKWLHNTKVELWYLEPEYETLRDLNIKKWDVDLWEKDLWAWGAIIETRDLKADFENWIAIDLDKYSLKASEIEIKDSTGNPIHVILNDWMIDFTDLSANKGVRLSSDILLDIWWSRLKIWRIFIDNDTLHQLVIKFDDEATIKSAATISSLTLPSFPLDFSFKLKWTKKVSNGLTGCYASLTKKYATKLKLWSIVPPSPLTLKQRERQATITNVDQVNRAIAEREADEELREKYRNIGWNIFKRMNLFFRRKFIKANIVSKNMKWKNGFDWSESGQSAAHRHQIEEKENLSDNLKVIVDIDATNYPQTRAKLDNLIKDFTWENSSPKRQWWIPEQAFKDGFKKILEESGTVYDTEDPTKANPNWKPINEIIKSNNIKSLSTNLMMQAKQFKAHQSLVSEIYKHIINNPTETDFSFNNWCRGEISSYIDTYDDIPDFLHQIKDSTTWKALSLDEANDIKTLKSHDKALHAIQAQSLKYKLQILDGGDEAYNVKKGWGLLTKAWRIFDDPTENSKFFNRHPHLKKVFWWGRWVSKLAIVPTALFFLTPGWPLATAWIIGTVSGLTAFLKKKSHYEEENRSYQRMQATNLTDYRNKRKILAKEVAWMKWHEGRFWWKKKRTRDQYRDYVLATQDQLELTSDLVAKIKTYLKKWDVLTPTEKNDLGEALADWLARLDYHKQTGQNFLWSDSPAIAEKEYKQLQNAIIWWTLRLWIDVKDLKKPPYLVYYDGTKNVIENWTWNEHDTQWYLKARKRFGRRSNLKAIDSALLTWGISFGLSYLASSLASTDTVKTKDTYTDKSSWTYGWEYNPWHVDESLLISWSWPTWSINPEMYNYINWSTSEITKCQLYSSVDSLRCSASYWASELAKASWNISASLSNPVIAWNTDLMNAVSNYMSDVTTKVWMIPWLDAWNHDLVIARAYEALNSWVLDPIIKSRNTSLVVDPTCFTWVNWWVQASSTGTVWQAFRNMWILWLDYVEKWTEEVVNHVTRAIAIPTWLNTFWSPKSDPK